MNRGPFVGPGGTSSLDRRRSLAQRDALHRRSGARLAVMLTAWWSIVWAMLRLFLDSPIVSVFLLLGLAATVLAIFNLRDAHDECARAGVDGPGSPVPDGVGRGLMYAAAGLLIVFARTPTTPDRITAAGFVVIAFGGLVAAINVYRWRVA